MFVCTLCPDGKTTASIGATSPAQCVADDTDEDTSTGLCYSLLQLVTVCYSLVQFVTVGYSLLQFVTACNSLLQVVTACYSLLQLVTVCNSL